MQWIVSPLRTAIPVLGWQYDVPGSGLACAYPVTLKTAAAVTFLKLIARGSLVSHMNEGVQHRDGYRTMLHLVSITCAGLVSTRFSLLMT